MNRFQPTRYYIAMMAFFIAALAVGALFFLIGMTETTYLVNDGVRYWPHNYNRPKFEDNLQGFIFSISFLVAGLLMILMIILPDEGAVAQRGSAPEPRRRAPPQPAPQQPQRAAAPPPSRPAPQAAPPPVAPAPEVQLAAPEEAPEPEAAPAPVESQPPPPPPEPERSLEEEIQASSDLPDFDEDDSRFDDTEDDVVYGSGRITEDSVWNFIQTYPDSAVKFLYRRTLDNRPLSPQEEDIYRKWEQRGLSRAKVREIALDITGWTSLPDDLPHNIWRELRDRAFELTNR